MRDSIVNVDLNLHKCKSLVLLSLFFSLIIVVTSSIFSFSVYALDVNNASTLITSSNDNPKVDYYFQHGNVFDIKRECFYSGAPCNSSVIMCYLTVYATSSNSTLIMNGSAMKGQTNFYNMTVYNTTLSNGNYRCAMYCSDGISSGSEIFYIQINQTGDDRGNSLFLILSLAGVLVLGFGILFKNEYIGFIAGAIFIVTGVYVMIYGFANLSDMYTRTISYACIGLGFIFEIAAGYKVAEETGITSGGIFSGDSWE
jgi:hypothetical protein